jgi:hypothetical protein
MFNKFVSPMKEIVNLKVPISGSRVTIIFSQLLFLDPENVLKRVSHSRVKSEKVCIHTKNI